MALTDIVVGAVVTALLLAISIQGCLYAAATLGCDRRSALRHLLREKSYRGGRVHAGFGWVSVVVIVSSALAGAAALRVGARTFGGWGEILEEEEELEERGEGQAEEQETETKEASGRASLVMALPAAGLVLLSLAVGVSEAPVRLLHAASVAFLDFDFYRSAVLENVVAEAPPLTAVPIKTGPALVKTAVTLLGALVVAGAALFATRLPEGVHRFARAAESAAGIARRWHSGHVGDYVMWMTAGMAVLSAVLFAMVLRS